MAIISQIVVVDSEEWLDRREAVGWRCELRCCIGLGVDYKWPERYVRY